MTNSLAVQEEIKEAFPKTIVGFWVYLMTDCILFTTLFITFAVLRNQTFGGPSAHELFNLSTPFAETMVLLFSSFACGLGIVAARHNGKKALIGWLILAFLLGLSFILMEVTEFTGFVQEGNSWRRSAFLSSFFTLVGTHGLHVSIGLLWLVILVIQLLVKGITITTFRRLACFCMFWHFLDLIWIFIFTFVYLIGVA